jgi:hypothetical protein
MNRGMADLTAPGPPRDLPHRRTASLRVQSIKADKEISDRTWRRRFAPDRSHPGSTSYDPNYVRLRRALYATAGQDLDVRVFTSTKGYVKASITVKVRVQIATSYAHTVMLRVTLPSREREQMTMRACDGT